MRPLVLVFRCRGIGPNVFGPNVLYRVTSTTIAMPHTLLRSMRRPMFQFPLTFGFPARLARGSAGRLLSAPVLAALILSAPANALAAESLHCLSGDEQRAAIANGKSVPLATVIHSLRRAPKDVIKAQLCQEPDRLIYKLTLLGRDGKVKRAIVDATNGAVVGER
jgi:hypothetical protein